MEDKQCEFEYNGMRCCSTEIVGMSRCKHLCKIHFNTIRMDNIRRFNKSEDIPKELIFTKELTNGQSAPRLLTSKVTKEVKI